MSSEENTNESRELKPISREKTTWVKATSEDLNFDIESILARKDEPIVTREQLDDHIKLLAIHIRKFVDSQKLLRKTVYQYFVEIKEAGDRLGLNTTTIRRITEEIFREYGVGETHIRKVIPHELKNDLSKSSNIRSKRESESELEQPQLTNMQPTITNVVGVKPGTFQAAEVDEIEAQYQEELVVPNDTAIQLKNALLRIKEYEKIIHELREKLANSVMIGQETKIYKGFVPLDNNSELPITVAINLKEDKMEYVEIDTESVRRAAEESISVE